MVSAILGWYAAITLIGGLAWPLAFRLLPGLPDRGYTLSRALGLLLTGYVFWLLGSLGFVKNTPGGIILAALIVLSISLWIYQSRPDRTDSLGRWFSSHRAVILTAEALFVAALASWTLFRAHTPDIAGTEKPMEMAFLASVLRSPAFPPLDPWLSGYAISYYYFGYVLIALMADLTGVSGGVAFNLGIALLFALTLLGSYGLVYNLTAARRSHQSGAPMTALLGPLFVALLGNLAGLLELVRALQFPLLGAGFWAWLDLEDLADPISGPLWPPSRWRFWWWWRASRVVRDRDLTGVAIGLQPIDEFPFFSFLLGDMHPHVLALPFVLLALALAFGLVHQREEPDRSQLALCIVVFGGLAFLNTWDLPIYLFILISALALRGILRAGTLSGADLGRAGLTGLGILAGGIAAYLPWYISFGSQAGGILPNALFPTRLHQFLVMFGPFQVIIWMFLVDRAIRHGRHMDWRTGMQGALLLLAMLVAAMLILSAVAVSLDPGARAFLAISVDAQLQGQPDAAIRARLPGLAGQVLRHRLAHPLTALFLTGLIVLCLAALIPRPPRSAPSGESTPASIHPANGFVTLLILTGALLTLGPEFVYLRDVFGQRLNTVFKFYYAAWILFAVASAYATHELLAHRQRAIQIIASILIVPLIAGGLVYPAFAIPARLGDFQTAQPTLDGLDFIRRSYPGDYAGIRWLEQNAEPGAVVLEAVGGQYSYYARVSMATGIPTVLGWPGHERQWRGARYAELAGTREEDILRIYQTPSIDLAQGLLQRYNVTYIFVGTLERNPAFAPPAGLQKFDRFLPAVYRDQDVVIYRADQPLIEEAP